MESFLGLSPDQLPGGDSASRLPLRLYVGLFFVLVGTIGYLYFH